MLTDEQIDAHVAAMVRASTAPTVGSNKKDGEQALIALATHTLKCITSIAVSLQMLSARPLV